MNEFTYRYMTNKGKKEHLKNGIYYKIGSECFESHRNVSMMFGFPEPRFSKEWKEFKKENNLIKSGNYHNNYVNFDDCPKYPCYNSSLGFCDY
tara:strand:- start:318 stop:596 length:279 start_codon:yes stop_codon:yes gene_type:complete